ncbi:acyl-CoA dehydrogenase family protein [Candidatus Poriferisodalis sp.]|uniref:acyl-CoA dehydrogenase family protein n=1 Tax=Candidatus Poriferisodalis sp. TaxID=3101277 RepID=UPI003AF5F14C
MDFSDEDPRRARVRAWIEANPEPTPRQLAEAGWVAPHWPRPWGLDADPMDQLLIDDEFAAAGIEMPHNGIAIGWAGPTIIHAGSAAQKERYLPPMLTGEEIWCQLFSEPDAGSDLARLATRAVRDGDHYIVNGTKIWSSGAHQSKFGILIARTDPDVAKHQGISYFICPMDAPGIELRPIIDMTTAHSFNQIFFTDVEIPVANRIGGEGDGWRLARVTLGNERVSLSGEGCLWGNGPTATDLVDLVRESGGVDDPVLRARLARVFIEGEVLRLIRLRTVAARLKGAEPGPEASVRKALADDHGQNVMRLAKDLSGASGMLTDAGPVGTSATDVWVHAGAKATGNTSADGASPSIVDVRMDEWHYGFLFSSALTIGGGTAEVQRNIVAERVLGLPRDFHVESGLTWAEARAADRV